MGRLDDVGERVERRIADSIVERRVDARGVERIAPAANVHEERVEVRPIRGSDELVSFLRPAKNALVGKSASLP